jgi:hypothetical protein
VQAIIILELSGDNAEMDDHSSTQRSPYAIDSRLIAYFASPSGI